MLENAIYALVNVISLKLMDFYQTFSIVAFWDKDERVKFLVVKITA